MSVLESAEKNPNMTYEELREQLDSLLWSHAQWDTDVRIDKETIELIQLFATLCTEVIGKYNHHCRVVTYDNSREDVVFNESVEAVLEDQKTRLAQLTTKSHDN